tara:strand:+ start:363 stop:1583 length:1221 start_codon:yes stop_codon:yes gene_type:complete
MKRLLAFSFYDVGNSVFPMIVVTTLTSSYFVNQVADNPQTGTALWQLTIGMAGILTAFFMPYIGNLADSVRNGRLILLRLFTVICIASISIFWFILPSSNYVVIALIILLIGSISYEASNGLYNASLKSCSSSNLTFTSGIGFGSGYLGGVIVLVLLLQTIILPEKNLFNIPTESQTHLRFVHIILALWFLIFSIPLLFLYKFQNTSSNTIAKIPTKIKNLIWDNGLTNTGRFLLARMLYADGLVIVITGIGIFGTSVIGLSIKEILLAAILANISGAIGCYLYGIFFKNDKQIIMYNLLFLILIVAGISISKTPLQFITLTIIGTFFSGPLQSSSRVVMANLTPDDTQGFGFGMFTLSGKITAFIGPILAGLLTLLVSQRVGFGFSIVLLLSGLFLMIKVNYKNT